MISEPGIREMVESAQANGKLPMGACAHLDGASRLLRLADLAEELGAGPVAEEARELAARVSEGRFYVACVGQFKRGKSTLLNALIGHDIIPTGFVPVTAVPTVIRFGDVLRTRIRMRDGSWQDIAVPHLKEYVTEELNPENRKGVDGAEVLCQVLCCPRGCVLWTRPAWVRSSPAIPQPHELSFLTLMRHWL